MTLTNLPIQSYLDRLTHKQIHNGNVDGLALGGSPITLAQALMTSAVSGISTETTLASVTATVPAGRVIKVSARTQVRSTISGDDYRGTLYMDGNRIQLQDERFVELSGTGDELNFFVTVSPSAGSHTFKVTLQRIGGSGTLSTNVASDFPGVLLVEDITGSPLPYTATSVPVGVLAQATGITSVNGITAATTLLSVNVTVPAGRTLKISAGANVIVNAAGTRVLGGINLDGVAVGRWLDRTMPSTSGYSSASDFAIVSPAAGSHTITMDATALSNSLNIEAGPTEPIHLVVEDITPTPAPANTAPSSTLGYAANTTGGPYTGLTTDADIPQCSVTVTVPDGRRLRITGYTLAWSTVTGDGWHLLIQENGSTIEDNGQYIGTQGTLYNTAVIRTPSAGTYTYKLRFGRYAGSGTGTIPANATQPAYILVEDITATSVLPTAIVPGELVANSSALPASPAVGTMVYEPDTGIIVIWTGTEWRRIAPPGVQLSRFTGVGSTTSGPYVDFPGPVDIPFIKRSTSTALMMRMTGSDYMTGAIGSNHIYGLRINGVDYDLVQFFHNNLSEHHSWSGSNYIGPGLLAAGSYSARVRWHCGGTTATMNVDTNDLMCVEIQEITPT